MGAKPRILIAEPDPDIRAALQIYFEANGYRIQTVEMAADVIKAARPWQPNAILISAEFTDRNPFQVCQALLDDTLTSHIPVLILLHINERRARLEALEAGASDIVTRPFDIEELRLRTEAAIRLSTLHTGAQ